MELAINGGQPIRKNILQYGKQTIDNDDKQAVLDVLNENKYLTTGPRVRDFEDKVKKYCNVKYACAVNSGTAALHLAVHALNLKPTDEIIVSCLSFVASSNAILYCGVKPVFCDIDENTMKAAEENDEIFRLTTKGSKLLVEKSNIEKSSKKGFIEFLFSFQFIISNPFSWSRLE